MKPSFTYEGHWNGRSDADTDHSVEVDGIGGCAPIKIAIYVSVAECASIEVPPRVAEAFGKALVEAAEVARRDEVAEMTKHEAALAVLGKKTYVARCICGEIEANEETIADAVAEWHDSEDDLGPLHRWLGMNRERYAAWVERRKSIADIVLDVASSKFSVLVPVPDHYVTIAAPGPSASSGVRRDHRRQVARARLRARRERSRLRAFDLPRLRRGLPRHGARRGGVAHGDGAAAGAFRVQRSGVASESCAVYLFRLRIEAARYISRA
jgi:hypothetical protein